MGPSLLFIAFMQGACEYLFSLVYTSLSDILPRIQQLWRIARKDDTKQGRMEAKLQLGKIIQVLKALLRSFDELKIP